MTFEKGELVDGRYRIEDLLGEGGHGSVYRATDEMLGSHVAIKVLHSTIANEPGFKTRMMREARAMGALSGTSAVQVLSFGKTEYGGMYIVMEMVIGRTLEAYLREIEEFGGQLSIAKLIELIGPIVDTLEAAHAQDIIHRDLKPGNIMVLDTMGRGPVRLLDFGLVKDLKADPLTMEGLVAGSPSYMAPEVWYGKPDMLDHRIDVYALGAVIFRALTGAPPFDGSEPIDRLIVAVTRGARPKLSPARPDLPEIVDDWAAKALAIKREDRFPSVRALWQSFQAVTEPVQKSRPLSRPSDR